MKNNNTINSLIMDSILENTTDYWKLELTEGDYELLINEVSGIEDRSDIELIINKTLHNKLQYKYNTNTCQWIKSQ